MLRFYYVIIISTPLIITYLITCYWIEKHAASYTEQDRYRVAQHYVRLLKRNGRIDTVATGTENLPDDGGYVMFANHQGKYDSLGIINTHEKPCTFLIDEKRSHLLLVHQFADLLRAARINKQSIRGQVAIIKRIAEEVEEGRRYIIFPEGGYDNNQNTLQDFLPGAFKCAMKARRPIVPVAIIDSWRPFGMNSLRRVRTQVHYLKPLLYEEYRNLKSVEIAALVKNEIQACLDQYAS